MMCNRKRAVVLVYQAWNVIQSKWSNCCLYLLRSGRSSHLLFSPFPFPLPIGIPSSSPPRPRRPHVTAVPSFHFPGFSPHLSSSRIYLFLLSQIKGDPSPKKTPSIAINIGGRSLSNGGLPSTRLLRLDPLHRSPFCLFWPSTSNHLNGDRGNAKNTKV